MSDHKADKNLVCQVVGDQVDGHQSHINICLFTTEACNQFLFHSLVKCMLILKVLHPYIELLVKKILARSNLLLVHQAYVFYENFVSFVLLTMLHSFAILFLWLGCDVGPYR